MHKLLMIAYYFPPVAASGAMRPLNFSRFLEFHGWSCHVLTVHPASVYPAHPFDSALLSKLPKSMRVDSVPDNNPLRRLLTLRSRVRAMFRVPSKEPFQRSDTAPSTSERNACGPASRLKDLLLDWAFGFPDPQCAWRAPAIAFAERLPREAIPDVVWATGGPWTSLVIGKEIASRWNVPFVADYRDPWTSNPYVSFPSDYLNRKARRLEQSVCTAAARIVTNTEELRIRLEQDYPNMAGKFLTITNGFDTDSFTMPPESQSKSRPQKALLEICHFGTVYRKRTPVVLLQALERLWRAGRVTDAQLCFRFVGAWEVTEPECEAVAQNLEKHGLLKREPPVPHDACLRQMTEADALLVIQPDSPLQIPGKIYEYIATGRPLLLVGGEGATANLVQRNRFGLVCANDLGQIQQTLAEVVEGRRTLAAPDREQVNRFDYRMLTSDLAGILDQVRVGR